MYKGWAKIQLTTPGSAIQLAKDCATGPSIVCLYTYLKLGAKNKRCTYKQVHEIYRCSKTCVKRPLSKRPKMVFQTNYPLMQVKSIAECSKRKHSAILSTFIKQPVVIKIFVLSIFEWPFYTGFTITVLIPHAQNADIASKVEGQTFNLSLHQHPYFVYASSEGSGNTLWMCRLIEALAASHYDKYQNLMCWLIQKKTFCGFSMGSKF